LRDEKQIDQDTAADIGRRETERTQTELTTLRQQV